MQCWAWPPAKASAVLSRAAVTAAICWRMSGHQRSSSTIFCSPRVWPSIRRRRFRSWSLVSVYPRSGGMSVSVLIPPGGIGYDRIMEHHHGTQDLNSVALSATLHCLTGCAIGEIVGMVVATALGLSQVASIHVAILFAFVFGYALTSLPLLRAGLAFGAVVPIALASDTFSIGLMEVVDNAIVVVVPGALDAGLGDILFWGSLSFALAIAGAAAFPLNRWLIARGKGHTAVHNTGIHGGLPPRLVGSITAAAFVFGATVLVADALG